MKVLIINYEFPPIGGGGATASYQIAERLSTTYNIKVLTGGYGDLPRYEKVGHYEIYRVPAIRRKAESTTPIEMITFMLSGSWHGWKLAREWQPDVMAAFFGIPSGAVSWFIHKITRIPYTVSLLGGDVPGFQPYDLKLYHAITKPFIKSIWNNATGVSANSIGLAALANQTLPELPIQVITNGINHEMFYPSPVSPPLPTRILFVGRLVQQKAPLDLIRAAAILREKTNHPFVVEIVGDGPLLPELRQLTRKLNLTEQIQFSGWCPFEQLADRYRSAHIFCLPSLDEGMPYVVVQAMACGLPIVGTDIMGTQELVKHGVTGYLSPVSQPEKLAESFSLLIENQALRQQMGMEGAKVAAEYNWERFTASYIALFEQAHR